MIDLERFIAISEEDEVLWNIWAKVGDTDPSDRGLKDGELTQCYPVELGMDKYGAPYGHVGNKDLSGYVIFQILGTKDVIREYFKCPNKKSLANKRNRKTNYYIDIDKHFNLGDIVQYRDHTRKMPILKDFSLSKISDYRKTPERHDKAFVHGSVTTGTYTVGAAGDYADLKTAMDDVGAVASNTLTFSVIGANSPGANIDFDKVTNADGLIRIHSTLYDYRDNPLITGGGKWWQMDGRCNYLIEHINVNGISLHYDDPTTGSTGRTHTIRCNVFDRTTNHDPIFPDIDDPGTPISIKFYGNVIFGRTGVTGARCNNFIIGSGWTSGVWADNIFIENNTFICDFAYSSAALTVSGTDINAIFHNNVVYQSTGTNAWEETLSTGTVTLNNCARNKALSGTFTENDCITDLVAGDFLSVTIAEDDCGKIIVSSRLQGTGAVSGNIPGYTFDIIGDVVSATEPSIGAFSGADPITHLNIIDNNTGSGDIKLFWDTSEAEGDFKVTGSDLELDDGIVSSVLISLFSDRRASDNDILPDINNNDKRGWWGDSLQGIGGDEIGSKLWLLSRAKTTTENLRIAEGYAREALQWMIDDGIVSSIEVTGYRVGSVTAPVLGLKVTITLLTEEVTSVNLESINVV